MKQIQKGFTLIELMIVVAIIGILAAVAIPAYQDYVVKAKLSKVQSTLDPIKLALSMYYQENGAFPTVTGATAINAVAAATSDATGLWTSLGFTSTPAVPTEVSLLTVNGMGTTPPAANQVPATWTNANGMSIDLVLTLANIKAGTIDTGTVTITGFNPSGTAIIWECTADTNPTGGATLDTIVKKYFTANNVPCP